MQGFTITVRMEDGEAPVFNISAREDYHHREQGVPATSTVTLTVPNGSLYAAEVRKALQALLDEARGPAQEAAYDGAIVNAATSIRRKAEAEKEAAGLDPDEDADEDAEFAEATEEITGRKGG